MDDRSGKDGPVNDDGMVGLPRSPRTMRSRSPRTAQRSARTCFRPRRSTLWSALDTERRARRGTTGSLRLELRSIGPSMSALLPRRPAPRRQTANVVEAWQSIGMDASPRGALPRCEPERIHAHRRDDGFDPWKARADSFNSRAASGARGPLGPDPPISEGGSGVSPARATAREGVVDVCQPRQPWRSGRGIPASRARIAHTQHHACRTRIIAAPRLTYG